jgi:hypothetical protein
MATSYITQGPSITIDEAFPVIVRHTKANSPQSVGVITAGQLVRRYTVPQRDARNKRGVSAAGLDRAGEQARE